MHHIRSGNPVGGLPRHTNAQNATTRGHEKKRVSSIFWNGVAEGVERRPKGTMATQDVVRPGVAMAHDLGEDTHFDRRKIVQVEVGKGAPPLLFFISLYAAPKLNKRSHPHSR